jgi:hypothetical protein
MLGRFADFVSQGSPAVGDDAIRYLTDGVFDPHGGLSASGVIGFTVRLNPTLIRGSGFCQNPKYRR